MAASSVTCTGQGSADKVNKGGEHRTLAVEKLIGPRMVSCGNVTLNSGTPSTGSVVFSQPLTSVTGYFVLLTPVGTTSGAGIGVAASTLATTGFVVTGPNSSTATVNWSLVYNPDPAAGVMI